MRQKNGVRITVNDVLAGIAKAFKLSLYGSFTGVLMSFTALSQLSLKSCPSLKATQKNQYLLSIIPAMTM